MPQFAYCTSYCPVHNSLPRLFYHGFVVYSTVHNHATISVPLFTPHRVGGGAPTEENNYHVIELTEAQVNNKVLSKQVLIVP